MNNNLNTVRNNSDLVVWEEKYAVGIDLIDLQHKELIYLTNELYHACLTGDEVLGPVFKEAMSRMVEYVRYHFTAEQNLLIKVKYPDYPEHKKQHDTLVNNILDAVKGYNEGKRFAPHSFVRTLKDWIFGHIAVADKIYAAYVADQIKKGLLNIQAING